MTANENLVDTRHPIAWNTAIGFAQALLLGEGSHLQPNDLETMETLRIKILETDH